MKLNEDVVEQLRDLVYADPDQTMASFTEEALAAAMAKYEKKHGEIKPRAGKLKVGRPVTPRRKNA